LKKYLNKNIKKWRIFRIFRKNGDMKPINKFIEIVNQLNILIFTELDEIDKCRDRIIYKDYVGIENIVVKNIEDEITNKKHKILVYTNLMGHFSNLYRG